MFGGKWGDRKTTFIGVAHRVAIEPLVGNTGRAARRPAATAIGRLAYSAAVSATRRFARIRVAAALVAGLLPIMAGCGSTTEPSGRPPTSSPISTDLSTPGPSPTGGQTSAGPPATPLPPGVVSCPGAEPDKPAAGRAATAHSTNWSGYVVHSGAPQFSCVEAAWTQPSVACPTKGSRTVAFWVGLGGVGQTGLEQIGTQTACTDGRDLVVVWHESLPRERAEVVEPLDVRTGDRIWAQVRWMGGAHYRLAIVDITHPQQLAIDDANSRLRRTSAEWIVEAPTAGCPTNCHVLSMPNYHRLRFTGVLVIADGIRRPLNGPGFVHERETMISRTGATRSIVSSTARDGTSFALDWKHA